MVGITCGTVAELVDRVQGMCSSQRSPYSNAEPKRTQGSTAITDEFLEKISGHLSGLDELKIKGCQKVTHEGLASVLRHNKNGIKKLSAESISPLLVRHNASSSTQQWDLIGFPRTCESFTDGAGRNDCSIV